MKPLNMILILSGILAMLCSCKETDISLVGLFWDPPQNIDVLYLNGAEKGETFGNVNDQTALFKKNDTLLQFGYRDKKLFYEYLQFNASNAKVVFDSIILKHNLQSGNGLRSTDTTAEFISYYLSDGKSNYQFAVRDTSIHIKRVWQ